MTAPVGYVLAMTKHEQPLCFGSGAQRMLGRMAEIGWPRPVVFGEVSPRTGARNAREIKGGTARLHALVKVREREASEPVPLSDGLRHVGDRRSCGTDCREHDIGRDLELMPPYLCKCCFDSA